MNNKYMIDTGGLYEEDYTMTFETEATTETTTEVA